MPGLDTTFLTAITREMFLPGVKNQMYNESPLFNRFFAAGRVRPMTGTSLLWLVPIKKHTSKGRFTGYDVFATQPINPVVQASLSEGSYYASLAISGTEKRKNTGPVNQKLLDAIQTQFKNAMSSLKEDMYTDLYGSGAAIQGRYGLIGLAAAVASNNTYAGIDRTAAAYASWQANVDSTSYALANLIDQTTTSWLPHVMRTNYLSAVHDHSPDLIVTTKAIYTLYQDIYGSTNYRENQEVADLGFGGVKFQNGTMVFDDFCTTNYMYMLSLQDWSVFVYAGANFDMPDEGWMRPPNQDAYITQIIWSGQLRLDSPWHQAVIQSIATS